MTSKILSQNINCSNWEGTVQRALAFVNQSIENKGQLVNIVTSITPKHVTCSGNMVIYYHENTNKFNKRIKNNISLQCKCIRHNNKTHSQSSDSILAFVNEKESNGVLFGVTHALQACKFPITFVWFWNVIPINDNNNYDDDSKEDNEMLKRKLSEIALQIQTLTTGLNNVIRVNQELNTKLNLVTQNQQQFASDMNKNHDETGSKLDTMTSAINTLAQGNEDQKSNDHGSFDPVYAAFYYWINNTVCLPQYMNAFQKHGYDSMAAVVELNDEELKSIGVEMKGHRIRFLKALEKCKTKLQMEGT
eukprot:1106752_1